MARNVSILVVEDNADMAELYRAYLEPRYCVTLASSAANARRALAAQSAELVILDLMLTDSAGDRFLRELRDTSRFAGLKVVLVSGRNDVSKMAEHYGIHWLRKPFNMEELLGLVERIAASP